ncbi:MAG: transposase [Planctomycetales bacterium]|nr:transposase [Planctomycetales bacterium]
MNRAAALLDREIDAWRNRLVEVVEYLSPDTRYENVRIDGAVRNAAVLVAVGILLSGLRSVLGVSVRHSVPRFRGRQDRSELTISAPRRSGS